MDQQIIRTDYAELMQKSYIDYSMSVIVSRAIPDVRDGLKPVQRRTLYDMHELGIKYDKPYRKCARIVGDTMGKYHPHGDSSIYEALVVMAQDFKKGLPLVDGHGNFGSIEGDGAAAMRYTEAKLQKITQFAYLSDLDKNVVDFVPNFDETEKEPEVLPVRIPNLLINGAEGIAVGMATSIPPHNLGEVIEATAAYIKNPNITTEELMEYIQGPDFPTGGIVVNKDDLLSIYETGQGKIKLRGRVEVEKIKGGKERLIITEIPYTMIGANIGKFLNDVCNLIESRKITDITDISNQSSKEGIRIVFDLKKGADVEKICNILYKKTKLEDTFGVNMLAVSDKRPETMGLKTIIQKSVDFQQEINTRKYTTLLNKELDKKEVQEGLIKAVDVIDLIIEILRGSKNVKDAKRCLVDGETENISFKSEQSKVMAGFLRFTERQAEAILEMKLQKLIGLEIDALVNDYENTKKNIDLYQDILNNPKALNRVILNELKSYIKEYAKPRKTTIDNVEEAVVEEAPIVEEPVCFIMDRFGYSKCIDINTYEKNKDTIIEENKYVIRCMNTSKIAMFTDNGNLYSVKVLDVPLVKLRDKGQPIDNISNYDSTKETLLGVYSVEDLKTSPVVFVTSGGMIKTVDGVEFDVAKRSVAATKLADGDSLIAVQLLTAEETMVMISKKGMFLRINLSEIPNKKKAAIGVRGIKLAEGDTLTSAIFLTPGHGITYEYKNQNISLDRLKIGSRDTKGVKK